MTRRRRLTGRERREERRRARQPLPWLSLRLTLVAGGGAIAVVVATLFLVLVVFGDDDVSSQVTRQPTPTPTLDRTGPPPSDKTPIVSHTGVGHIELKLGDGEEVVAGKTLMVHYTGWLSDGTKFGTSIGGEPFQFSLGRTEVIPGWEEGVLGMKEGGTRRLFIPSALGYGASGSPPRIPPNADLTFDVELLDVLDAPITPTPATAATPTVTAAATPTPTPVP